MNIRRGPAVFRKMKARAEAVRTIAALLRRAEEIARARGATEPGAEHLVLAALDLVDGTATQALERLGTTGEAFRAALDAQEVDDLARVGVRAPDDRISTQLPDPSPPHGVYRSEPSAQELFQAAGDAARRSGGTLVGAHVLHAAAGLQHGPTARAFERMGIDRAALSTAAEAEIATHAP